MAHRCREILDSPSTVWYYGATDVAEGCFLGRRGSSPVGQSLKTCVPLLSQGDKSLDMVVLSSRANRMALCPGRILKLYTGRKDTGLLVPHVLSDSQRLLVFSSH